MPDTFTVYLEGVADEQDAFSAFATQSFTVTMEGPPGPAANWDLDENNNPVLDGGRAADGNGA